MHMVGHQHVGMNGNAIPQRRFTQIGQIANVIAILEETRLTVVSPLNDMLWYAGEVGTRLTWHRI